MQFNTDQASDTKTVWILEDDADFVNFYRSALQHKYALQFFSRLKDFRKAIQAEQSNPDLIIADLLLKDGSFLGFFSANDQKALLKNSRVLVASAVDDLDVYRLCYNNNVLDFITKPFKQTELQAKVERILLLSDFTGGVKIDFEKSRAITRSGDAVHFTSKELQILSILRRKEDGCLLSELAKEIWPNSVVSEKTIMVHIFNIRKKLHRENVDIVLNTPGQYRLVELDRQQGERLC